MHEFSSKWTNFHPCGQVFIQKQLLSIPTDGFTSEKSFCLSARMHFENKIGVKKLSFYKISSSKSDIVPITESEEQYLLSMESKTIAEIVDIITNIISDIEDEDLSNSKEENFKNYRKKNKLKNSLIDYHTRVM